MFRLIHALTRVSEVSHCSINIVASLNIDRVYALYWYTAQQFQRGLLWSFSLLIVLLLRVVAVFTLLICE